MRQGGAPPTGKWMGSPLGGVKAPEPLILPDPAERFADTAARLEALSVGHPMEEWLRFMAKLSRAQHIVATAPLPLPDPRQDEIDQAVAARLPALSADSHRLDVVWREGLVMLLDSLDMKTLPSRAASDAANLRGRKPDELDALAEAFLRDTVAGSEAGPLLYVAAALQVYFTRLAAALDAEFLRLLPQRGLCPCCGSPSVSAVVTGSGDTPGTRYLYCSLCSTAWNHVRAVCVTCGDTRRVSLKGIEGDSGVVKAETCDECQTYAKVFYQAKDMKLDPYADDLATLGLDVLVAEAGWARHAPNPLLLVEG